MSPLPLKPDNGAYIKPPETRSRNKESVEALHLEVRSPFTREGSAAGAELSIPTTSNERPKDIAKDTLSKFETQDKTLLKTR